MFALANYHTELNLEDVLTLRGLVQFRRTSARSWLVRVPPSGPLLKVFQSGKVRITGGRSKSQIENAIGLLTSALQTEGLHVAEPAIDILNLVAVINLGKSVDLTTFVRRNGEVATYEPEQFPGAIVGLSRGTALVFAS